MIVFALVIVASIWALVWQIETQERRVTQLECALAQAHAENDTLEVMLENMDARTGGGARWLR
jgi:hypothetical protein